MPVFEYQAIDPKGKKIKGSIDAESLRTARQKLRTDGIFPTDIKESTRQAVAASKDVLAYFRSQKVGVKDLSIMTRQLGTLITAGLPLVSALSALSDQTSSPILNRILVDVREKVEEGSSLAGALGAYPKSFPRLYVNMVASGETSGTLDRVLTNLADYLEGQLDLVRRVRSALMYPIIMMIVCSLVIAGLFVFVIPNIVEIFEKQNVALPLPTQVMIVISNLVIDYWYLAILGIVLGIYGFKVYYSTPTGRENVDRVLLRIPIFGAIYTKVATARVAGTLGTLLGSGVGMLTCLDIAKNIVGNVHLSRALEDAREGVKEGKSLAAELKRSGLYPPMLSHMVAVGEKSGELEGMLEKAGSAYEREVKATLEGLTSLLEPLMMVVVGGIVFCIVISVLLPLADLIDVIQG